MTANTLLPAFLERLEADTHVNPWARLHADPDRYIWPSILHGIDQPLPNEIERESDGFPRPSWDASRPPAALALPAESWWEVADRRRHANDLRDRLATGKVADVNAAITDNLDLETLTVDCIDALDTPSDVAAAWHALSALRIVDPTCGSGAFLFSALGLLHTLYGAVLEAAERHVTTRPTDDLVAISKKAAEHPSRDYYLLKHATLNNLYGVDIMPEAVEIARLRLFLKLIAQIDQRADIEPLPDLDFNIRPGNTLVGAVTRQSIEQRVDVFNHGDIDAVMDTAAESASTYRAFADAQETGTEAEVREAKNAHQGASATIRQTLDTWWHEADGAKASLAAYLDSHRPFHWFIEFPEVFLEHGGFDIVIGNPPYVATTKISYEYSGFATDECSDIYAPCLERAAQITRPDGRLSMIVPMNLSWSRGFTAARQMIGSRFGAVWASTYDQMPSRLFEGVGTRNTIVVAGPGDHGMHTTSFNKWVAEFRPHLLPTQRYIAHETAPEPWPKVGHHNLVDLATRSRGGMSLLASRGATSHRLGHKKSANYWISIFVEDPPCLDANRQPMPQREVGDLYFDNEDDQLLALAVGGSRVMFLWWVFVGDAFHVLGRDLRDFPLNPQRLEPQHRQSLIDVGRRLRDRLAEPGEHLLWTPYKNAWYGNFDLTRCRDILADADNVLLEHFGLGDAREEFEVEYHNYMKSGGERPGTVRGGLPERDR